MKVITELCDSFSPLAIDATSDIPSFVASWLATSPLISIAEKYPQHYDATLLSFALVVAAFWFSTQKGAKQAKKCFVSHELFDHLEEGVMILSDKGSLSFANNACCLMLGVEKTKILGTNVADFLKIKTHEGFLESPIRLFVSAMKHSNERFLCKDATLVTKNKEISVECSVARISNPANSLVVIFRDITEKKAIHHAMKEQMLNDPLTNLPNRQYFTNLLGMAISEAFGKNEQLAVMLIDLDNFKIINNLTGYEFGDKILKAVSRRIGSVLPEGSVLGRWSGDEFIALLRNIPSASEAAQIAKNLIRLLREPLVEDGQEFIISASIGVGIYPFAATDPHNLIKNTDIALHKAKENGKNNFSFYTDTTGTLTSREAILKKDFRPGMAKREFVLYYQPKVDLATRKIIGAEALMRWIHPELGLIQPGLFIPIAEKTGLIVELGDYMLKVAAMQIGQWQLSNTPQIKIALNLSMYQFMQPDIAQKIGHHCMQAGIDPAWLEIEITESVAMTDPATVQKKLLELKELNVTISIDDFGTGYSSLSYLKKLPVNAIKIDQSFVREMTENNEDQMIVSAIVSMGHSLGLAVIAEGVETVEHAKMLQEMGCDVAQGYYYGKPMSAAEFERLLKENP